MTLGDVLGEGGRYRVINLLAFSNFSSVWLAKDRIKGGMAALKVGCSLCILDVCDDVRIKVEVLKSH